MATFVLIHGSWHGGWCFDAVKARLEALGHSVLTPDLPGMGGDEARLRAQTLQGWANFAADLCRTAPQRPVILAGHSRGGIVISQAAETAPEAIDALVYITAIMLPNGISRAQFKAMEQPNPAFDTIITPVYDGAGTVVDPAQGAAIFAQLSQPDQVASAMARLVAEPHGPRCEPVRITPERWGSIARTYIECSEDRTIPLSNQRLMQQMSPGARVVTLVSDHSPFLCCPDDLTEALLGAIPV